MDVSKIFVHGLIGSDLDVLMVLKNIVFNSGIIILVFSNAD